MPAGTVAVTETFALAHLPPDRVAKIIEPFLTKKGANLVVLADQSLLIVTDYAPNIKRIARLIELIDQAGPDRMLRFQRVDNVDANELSSQIAQILALRGGGRGTAATAASTSRPTSGRISS